MLNKIAAHDVSDAFIGITTLACLVFLRLQKEASQRLAHTVDAIENTRLAGDDENAIRDVVMNDRQLNRIMRGVYLDLGAISFENGTKAAAWLNEKALPTPMPIPPARQRRLKEELA